MVSFDRSRRSWLVAGGALGLSASLRALDLGGLGTGAPGSGRMVQDVRALPSFDRIVLAVPGAVELVQTSGPESVSITTDDNLQSGFEALVTDGELVLQTVGGRKVRSTQLRVVVALRQVRQLHVTGSSQIHATDLAAPKLSLNLSGSGHVQLERLAADDLTIAMVGSGKFSATGRVAKMQGQVTGSGELHLAHLAARQIDLALAGSGDATVWAAEALTVSVAGSGGLRYYGDARLRRSLGGSGSVIRLGPVPAGIDGTRLG